jgi:hypothetical protein
LPRRVRFCARATPLSISTGRRDPQGSSRRPVLLALMVACVVSASSVPAHHRGELVPVQCGGCAHGSFRKRK